MPFQDRKSSETAPIKRIRESRLLKAVAGLRPFVAEKALHVAPLHPKGPPGHHNLSPNPQQIEHDHRAGHSQVIEPI